MALDKLVSESVTVSTAGTAVALSSTSKLVSCLAIYALSSNTNFVYVGDSGVDSTNGMPLKPEGSIDIESQNDANGKLIEVDISEIYVDADTNGNEVRVTYLTRN